MAFKNSNLKYGSVAKWLHWIIAIFILVAYISVYYNHYFIDDRAQRQFINGLHFMFGVSVAPLVLLRLFWRWFNIQPDDEPGPRWQHLSALYAHRLLYFFMIVMPLTGWMCYGARSINFFWLFELPTFRGTALYQWLVVEQLGMTFNTFEVPFDNFHKEIAGPWIFWVLIAVHVVAALYHHYRVKDNTLKKMLPGGRVEY